MPDAAHLRNRLPAVAATALLHFVIIAALVNAIPKSTRQKAPEPEETFILMPSEPKAPPLPTRRSYSGETGITQTGPRYSLPGWLQNQTDVNGIGLALQSCAPENLGSLDASVRRKCHQLETALLSTRDSLPGAFRIKNSTRWETELLIKQGPLLVPCASPNNPLDVLYTLGCISKLIRNGYHPEDIQHYQR
ncbi:MAG: hypothetical protein KGJ78_01275 [Alphaproteobacteria bacterium]|nr:hypothetical protein [Alphaproteobacteria bacterium]